jgi:hypothetical protein
MLTAKTSSYATADDSNPILGQQQQQQQQPNLLVPSKLG